MSPQELATKRWLLARMRTIRAGMMLVVAKIDEIGIDLSEDVTTSEMAAGNLAALEEMPLYHIAHIFSPTESEAA
jgi:hypothetical protein